MNAFSCSPTSDYVYSFVIPGMSATARKRKEEVSQALKKLIQAKGKTPAMKYQQLLEDLRGQSETVSRFILSFMGLIFKISVTIIIFFNVMTFKNCNQYIENKQSIFIKASTCFRPFFFF